MKRHFARWVQFVRHAVLFSLSVLWALSFTPGRSATEDEARLALGEHYAATRYLGTQIGTFYRSRLRYAVHGNLAVNASWDTVRQIIELSGMLESGEYPHSGNIRLTCSVLNDCGGELTV